MHAGLCAILLCVAAHTAQLGHCTLQWRAGPQHATVCLQLRSSSVGCLTLPASLPAAHPQSAATL